ncbi:sirohydrochlorin cobaltochelatase [Methanobrevibacter sp. YE315]|uniref:sirohydrochlorin nickelochelatase n=1 Tax=Methanobrevibacter sp. YE315 TaxID=1609968 RepID=UPI000764DE3C|nr:sirohydrochlorin nickelochelatase [Methanobrevibacter sp. YE315]AMD16594.1 sirohydrochlorin cobaltochelatase [Methanobrevibacter sp. YE315]
MDTSSKLSNDTAVILVSHGSTLPYAEEVFTEIKEKFIDKSGFAAEIGYMKVSEPTIAGAVEVLKEEVDDLKKIIALPVFLAPGIHTRIDIPQLLGLEPLEVDPRCPDGNYPDEHYLSIADDVDFDGEIILMDSIGPRDELLDIIDKRVSQALSESELADDAKTGILLVTHGSRLNYNKEFATELYNKFEKTCDLPSSFGFMELCGPSIPESINKLAEENELDRLVVVPVFIAPGMHTTHDIPHILGFLDDHEHTHSHSHGHGDHDHVHDLTPVDFDGEILYPEPIKADDILIDILIDMVNEKS